MADLQSSVGLRANQFGSKKKGEKFGDKAFGSSTVELAGGLEAEPTPLHVQVLCGASGVEISEISFYGSGEKEVLFPPDTSFSVVDRVDVVDDFEEKGFENLWKEKDLSGHKEASTVIRALDDKKALRSFETVVVAVETNSGTGERTGSK